MAPAPQPCQSEALGRAGEAAHVAVSSCWYLIIRVYQINDILHSLEIESPCCVVEMAWSLGVFSFYCCLILSWAPEQSTFFLSRQREERDGHLMMIKLGMRQIFCQRQGLLWPNRVSVGPIEPDTVSPTSSTSLLGNICQNINLKSWKVLQKIYNHELRYNCNWWSS